MKKQFNYNNETGISSTLDGVYIIQPSNNDYYDYELLKNDKFVINGNTIYELSEIANNTKFLAGFIALRNI